MRTGASTLQSKPLRLRGQRFDVTRLWIVGFVAMQINPETAFGRNCAEPADRSRSIGHRPLEMWDTADYLYPKIQRSEQILFLAGRPKQPILGKRDQLEIEVGGYFLFYVDQRCHRAQTLITNDNLTPDCQQPLGNGHVAISQSALDHGAVRELRLQFAPQRNPFQQS